MISREQVEAIETNYRERHEVEGLTMIRYKPGLGTTYASDNDQALWTGVRLGQLAYRYAVDPEPRLNGDLYKTMQAVLKLLTVTGTPGVLVRWAYPLKGDPWSEIGYEPSVSHPGNTFGDRMRAGNLYERDGWAFETRTTRDQLSGILFGLTCAWRFCPFLRDDVCEAVTMLYSRFEDTNWSLRDHTNSTGGSSAHRVDSAQRLVIKALYHACPETESSKPSSCWFRWIWLVTAHYNRTFQNVYGLLNNSLDAHSLLLLKDHHTEEAGVRKWWERIYAQMERDFNPHFDAVALTFGDPRQWTMHPQLSRLVDHPYDGNYQWNRPPEEWWPEDSNTIGPGLDVLLPYWLNEYYKGEG